MKRIFALLLSLTLILCGCEDGRSQKDIPFEEGQCYAVAYLGYQSIDDLGYYTEKYSDNENIPVHYVSEGDYYLIIPRYEGMRLSIFKNSIETMESELIYEDNDANAFIVQCNVSDIFPDVTIRLEKDGEKTEFSPFISLKDGSVEIGDKGLDITKR